MLRKARMVLDCFSHERPELTLREVQAATGLPTSTCLRLLHNLVREGFCDRVGDRYRPGRTLLYWASLVGTGDDLSIKADPLLARLRDATGETACLYVQDGMHRTCIAMRETRHSVVRRLHVGKVMPLTAGSAGKVFLAYSDDLREAALAAGLVAYTPNSITDPRRFLAELERVRRQGWAVSYGERDAGAASLSAPVFDARGEVVAAIGIAGPEQRFDARSVRAWVAEVLAAGRELSTLLGHRGPAPHADAKRSSAR